MRTPETHFFRGQCWPTANLAATKDIYGPFGREDNPATLAKIASGRRWESWDNNGARPQGVPTRQPRTGPEGVALFA